jgi:hypothetical protein
MGSGPAQSNTDLAWRQQASLLSPNNRAQAHKKLPKFERLPWLVQNRRKYQTFASQGKRQM